MDYAIKARRDRLEKLLWTLKDGGDWEKPLRTYLTDEYGVANSPAEESMVMIIETIVEAQSAPTN